MNRVRGMRVLDEVADTHSPQDMASSHEPGASTQPADFVQLDCSIQCFQAKVRASAGNFNCFDL
jgi:hypothetical protein